MCMYTHTHTHTHTHSYTCTHTHTHTHIHTLTYICTHTHTRTHIHTHAHTPTGDECTPTCARVWVCMLTVQNRNPRQRDKSMKSGWMYDGSRGVVRHKSLLGHRPLHIPLFSFKLAAHNALLGYRNSPCLTHYTTVQGRKNVCIFLSANTGFM